MTDETPPVASVTPEADTKAGWILLFIAALCAVAFLAAQLLREDRGGVKGAVRFFTVASASPGGQYHSRVVDTLCRPYNDARTDGGDRCLAVPTGGSIMNLECLRAGQVDFALVQADACLDRDAAPLSAPGAGAARIACADMDGAPHAVPVLGRAHVESLHILTRRGFAGARTLDDLAATRGETIRIDIGSPGSGTQRVARHVLALAGIDLDARITEERIDPATGQTTTGTRPRFELRQFEPDQLVPAICERTALDIGFHMIGEKWLDDAPVRLNDPCGDGTELVLLPLSDALEAVAPYRTGILGGARVMQVDAYLLAGRDSPGATRERRAALRALLDRPGDPASTSLPATCYHPGIASRIAGPG